MCASQAVEKEQVVAVLRYTGERLSKAALLSSCNVANAALHPVLIS